MKVELEFKPRAHVSSQGALSSSITTALPTPPQLIMNNAVNNATRLWLAREHDPNVLGGQSGAVTGTFNTEDWFLRRQPRALCNFPLDKTTKFSVVPNNIASTGTTSNIPLGPDRTGMDIFSYKQWVSTSFFITAPTGTGGEFGGMIIRLSNDMVRFMQSIGVFAGAIIPAVDIYATYSMMLKGMDERDAAGGV